MIITNKKNFSVSGISIALSDPKTYNVGIVVGPVTIPKGKVGTLSTRTDNRQGILTVAAGHGFVGNDFFDLYWAGGKVPNLKVSTVTGTTITFAGTSGGIVTNLPIVTTAIVASRQVVLPIIDKMRNLSESAFLTFQFTGHTSKCLVVLNDQTMSEEFTDQILMDGGELKVCDIAGGDLNPLANINITPENTRFTVSNGSSLSDALFRLISLFNV